MKPLWLLVATLSVLGTLWHAWPHVPYFPIEVSRAAASHPNAAAGLQFLAWLTFPFIEDRYDGLFTVALWVIAYFDDVDYWFVHMCGVGLLGLAVAWREYNKRDRRCDAEYALYFYLLRIPVQFYAVVVLEGAWSSTLLGWPAAIKEKAMDIKYQGDVACRAPSTVSLFQLVGLVQWAALGCLGLAMVQ